MFFISPRRLRRLAASLGAAALGVSLMFADFWSHMTDRAGDGLAREGSPAFRAYLLWLTFPPMLLLFMDRPFGLIVAYAYATEFCGRDGR